MLSTSVSPSLVGDLPRRTVGQECVGSVRQIVKGDVSCCRIIISRNVFCIEN